MHFIIWDLYVHIICDIQKMVTTQKVANVDHIYFLMFTQSSAQNTCDYSNMQLDIGVSPSANIMTFRLALTHVTLTRVTFDPDP